MKLRTTTKLVRIGNSQGVRIPKAVIEQLGLEGGLNLVIRPDGLLIQPVAIPRAGWEEKFRFMAEQSDDRLLDGDFSSSTTWDEEEWSW